MHRIFNVITVLDYAYVSAHMPQLVESYSNTTAASRYFVVNVVVVYTITARHYARILTSCSTILATGCSISIHNIQIWILFVVLLWVLVLCTVEADGQASVSESCGFDFEKIQEVWFLILIFTAPKFRTPSFSNVCILHVLYEYSYTYM